MNGPRVDLGETAATLEISGPEPAEREAISKRHWRPLCGPAFYVRRLRMRTRRRAGTGRAEAEIHRMVPCSMAKNIASISWEGKSFPLAARGLAAQRARELGSELTSPECRPSPLLGSLSASPTPSQQFPGLVPRGSRDCSLQSHFSSSTWSSLCFPCWACRGLPGPRRPHGVSTVPACTGRISIPECS